MLAGINNGPTSMRIVRLILRISFPEFMINFAAPLVSTSGNHRQKHPEILKIWVLGQRNLILSEAVFKVQGPGWFHRNDSVQPSKHCSFRWDQCSSSSLTSCSVVLKYFNLNFNEDANCFCHPHPRSSWGISGGEWFSTDSRPHHRVKVLEANVSNQTIAVGWVMPDRPSL